MGENDFDEDTERLHMGRILDIKFAERVHSKEEVVADCDPVSVEQVVDVLLRVLRNSHINLMMVLGNENPTTQLAMKSVFVRLGKSTY